MLGTYLLPDGRDFFTEPLVALGLAVCVERALAGRELQASAALAFAVLARPQSAALVALLYVFLALHAGGVRAAVAPIARTVAPLAAAAAISVAYNVIRFGDPLQFGYEPLVDPGFTTPLLEGAGGLLLSPEKSIVLFAPAVVLVPFALVALWRSQRAVAALLVALFATSFVLAATWWSWMGGWSWGPRLVIPGIALLLVALGPWIGEHARRLRMAAALFALGAVLSIAAVIAPAGAQLLDRDPRADGPKLVRQVTQLPALTRHSIEATGDRSARDDGYRRHLALWQAGIVRQIGPAGWPIAVLGTIAATLALLRVARPLASTLRREWAASDENPR